MNTSEVSAPQPSLFEAFSPTRTVAWEARIKEDLAEEDYGSILFWHPDEDLRIKAFYRRHDLKQVDHVQGARPYRSKGRWQIRQDIHASGIDATNRLARQALDQGAESIGFSLGDSDAGLSLKSGADMERLLDGLPLSSCPVHFTGKDASLSALGLWMDEARRQGLAFAALQGTIDHAPLSRLAQNNTAEERLASEETAELIQATRRTLPKVRLITLDATPYRERGATAVQELSFCLAELSEYLAALADADCPPGDVVRSTHLRFPVGSSHLLEIAKLRAARLLFPQVGNAYDTSLDLGPADLFVQAFAGPQSYRTEPPSNLYRGATQAMAAVLGGADTVTVPPHTAASPDQDEDAPRLALNTQLILREEAHLHEVIDPAGGSYYLEVLTDRLARSAWSLFQKIEEEGGLRTAYQSGFAQQLLAARR